MKKTILPIVLFCFAAWFPLPAAHADEITLENGSAIIGTITRIDQKAILVRTDFAGVLSVDMTRVLTYTTDHPVYVAFPGHDPVRGTLTYTRKQTRIDAADGKVVVSGDAPEHVWPEGATDPRARHWGFEVGLDAGERRATPSASASVQGRRPNCRDPATACSSTCAMLMQKMTASKAQTRRPAESISRPISGKNTPGMRAWKRKTIRSPPLTFGPRPPPDTAATF